MKGHQGVRDDEGNAVRLIALSDGVFAIAMTLLALDIALPVGLDSARFEEALADVMPRVWAYALSFLVIAAFWRGHHQIFQYVERVDGAVIRLGLLSLGLIALMPFPTTLLAEYGDMPQSVAVYSGAVAVMGVTQLALMIALWKRPWLAGAELPDRVARNDAADLVATALVFAIAVPLAFVSPTGAKLWWAVLIPIKWALGERGKRLRAAADDSTPGSGQHE
ncbi:TMEM175 family protein [Streptomyces sp. NPDC096176]|uniref:TMEM175 family protein n=1 Tax=Streptomyces sp. NPDC096176 TaxID=3366079 RepID=UPI003827F983